MNEMFGMNVEQVRVLSGRLDAAAREVEEIVATLSGALQQTPWVGDDRRRFEDEWSSVHTAGLRTAAAALQHAALGARQNADDQQRASGR